MDESCINKFINQAIQSGGWTSLDRIFLINRLKGLIGNFENKVSSDSIDSKQTDDMITGLLEIAQLNGKLDMSDEIAREKLKEALMEFLTPPTSVVNALFSQHYDNREEDATDFYHNLTIQNGYIDRNELKKETVTINGSHLIIQKRNYHHLPTEQCLQCFESEGEGDFKNRNKRIIRMNLKGESWGFFYDCYPLMDEHAVFSPEKHANFDLTRTNLLNMIRLIDIFPHYFVSYDSVKNSKINHGCFFGEKKTIPLINSQDEFDFDIPGFVTVTCSLVKWPLSVIRLRTTSKKNLINSIEYLTLKWQQYSYPSLHIRAKNEKDDMQHSIMPIFRREKNDYVADLILLDDSDEFKRTDAYKKVLFDTHNMVDKLGIVNVKPDVIFDTKLSEIIHNNFEKQQIFKKTKEGKNAFIRFIDTL